MRPPTFTNEATKSLPMTKADQDLLEAKILLRRAQRQLERNAPVGDDLLMRDITDFIVNKR